jgi:hypothetical protein
MTSKPPSYPATSSASTSEDADGHHRATCPATTGKIRCPSTPLR